jgi:hypothetical protein
MKAVLHSGCVLAVLGLASASARAEMPEAIAAAAGQALVTTLHAEGAQVYECKADSGGTLTWQFREPVATLMLDGKTVGRHYAGPDWELADGSAVRGKVSARAAGATLADIPLLRLEASSRGSGMLSGVSTIQRINTKGGIAAGECPLAGGYLSVAYSADYTFYRK